MVDGGDSVATDKLVEQAKSWSGSGGGEVSPRKRSREVSYRTD